jgi:hypothetical protein
MHRASILPLVFLFAATYGVAQSVVSNMTLTNHRVVGNDCPVDMQASHSSGLPVSMNVGPQAATPRGLYQQIHLTMNNLASHEIVSAQITAHGYSNKQKMRELASASQGPDLSKSMDLVLDVKGKGHASSDLSFHHFTAVSFIDVNSITYADGSMWRAPSAGACRVIPDGVMLVSSMR